MLFVLSKTEWKGPFVTQENGSDAKKSKTPSQGELYRFIGDAINHSKFSNMPTFPRNFHVIEQAPGITNVIERSFDDTIEAVPDSSVSAAILKFCKKELGGSKAYALTDRQAMECARTWRESTDPVALPDVAAVRWKSEPGLCWHRVPFDLDTSGFAPTWYGLLNKMENTDSASAIMNFIGSLFDPDSYRQQYCWIFGPGGNGKGAITRFLYNVFGQSAHFLTSIPREPNQFFTRQFVNKRLIVVPDCENYSFPAGGLFKSLTGDDPIHVEPKHKQPYTTTLNCKFLFTSNQMPSLSSERADMRRAIFARLDGTPDWDAGFEERLWAEGGAFLHDCIASYNEACPNNGPIPAPTKEGELGDWVATLEEPFIEVFNEWFEAGAGEVAPGDMQMILKQCFPKRHSQIEFLRWVDRTHGVRKRTVRSDLGFRKVYLPATIKKSPNTFLAKTTYQD